MQDSCALALKEWAVTVLAFATGQTICAVRKGGIHEKRFEVPGRTCLLFPTYLHQSSETVQPRFRSALEQVLEHQPATGTIRLRYLAAITDVVPLDTPAHLDGLEPHVIWTRSYVEQRYRWRPRHPLQLLLMRVSQLPEEHLLPLTPAYQGCTSWITLEQEVPLQGALPVLDDRRYAAERAAVMEAARVVSTS